MQREKLIALDDLCASHGIGVTFIQSLQDTGLIETASAEETIFIRASQLEQTERFIRLYYELDINLEGIETIAHLLERISAMQHEIVTLRNRLRFYEDTDQAIPADNALPRCE